MQAIGLQLVAMMAVLVVVMGPPLVATSFMLRRKRLAREQRRSPLTAELLRTPGHALRERLDDARVDLAFDIMQLTVIPAFVLAAMQAASLASGLHWPMWLFVALGAAWLVYAAIQVRALHRRGAEMDQWRIGLDAELAVGQELDQLMRDGAVVFHDFPTEHFNVDHVVIAPQGVFAVETKGYTKPNRGGGADDAKVVYDGKTLAFPTWSSNKPLQQAERQAAWLAKWLSSATGEPVQVTPALALPGWYVERKGRGDVLVFSGRELRNHLLRARTAQPIAPEQVQRIVHQVEQRCRNVPPGFRAETKADG
jgi:hypothetical protein